MIHRTTDGGYKSRKTNKTSRIPGLLIPVYRDEKQAKKKGFLKQEGQEIKKNDPVVTIESDKSSVEIPSIFSGKIESIKVKVGDKISKGDLILSISKSKQSPTTSQPIPKDTENLIQEAENSLICDVDGGSDLEDGDLNSVLKEAKIKILVPQY